MDLIYSTSVKGEDLDNLCWRPAKSRGFEVCSYYHSLTPDISMSFPWKLVWWTKVLPRVAFFSWTAALGKILFIENLQQRGIIALEWCYMLKCSGELVDHLFLYCPIAYDLWTVVWRLFGLLRVMSQKVLDLLVGWQGSFDGNWNIAFWRAVAHCIM